MPPMPRPLHPAVLLPGARRRTHPRQVGYDQAAQRASGRGRVRALGRSTPDRTALDAADLEDIGGRRLEELEDDALRYGRSVT